MNCIIVGAGDFGGIVSPINKEADLVIAADGGYKYLKELGIRPDIWIGDGDSLKGEVDERDVDFIYKLPCEKDDTDVLSAVKIALEKGAQSIHLYGVLGGRIDHTMANIKIMSYLADQGVVCFAYDNNSMLTVLKDAGIPFGADARGILSVFSLTDVSYGVTIRGLKYALEDDVLYESDSIGVSNEFVGNEGYIEVKKGKLLIVVTS